MRDYSLLDRILSELDRGLRTISHNHGEHVTDNPAQADQDTLSEQDRALVSKLMRVNHAGEIAAQGLYHGQSLTARDKTVRQKMQLSANEEHAHLAWCEQRLQELDANPSVFNPVWYIGSYLIGAATGLLGDRWSLGFIAETEHQVATHLDKHIAKLPPQDIKSKTLLKKMRDDETKHGNMARQAGGQELPAVVKLVMKTTSKIMTKTAYWI